MKSPVPLLGVLLLFLGCPTEPTGSSRRADPTEVTNLKAEAHDTSLRVSWTDPDHADFQSVDITWSADSEESLEPLRVQKGIRAVNIPNLTNGKHYIVLVKANYTEDRVTEGLMTAGTPAPPAEGVVYSTEVGRRTPAWIDYDGFKIDESPATGLIFGAWTKIPLDWNNWGHNMDVLVVNGEGWNARCLVSNASVDGVDGQLIYNANTMLFMLRENGGGMWAGDYSGYMKGGHTEAQIRGWIWVAWQILRTDNQIELRQWLKFGPDGPVIRSDQDHNDVATFAAMRTFLKDPNNNQYEYGKKDDPLTPENEGAPTDAEIDAWTPGNMTDLQIGKDNGNLYNVFVLERDTEPTLDELNEWATSTGPLAGGAWGQWAFTWSASGPQVQDLSGNGRDLTPLSAESQFLPGLPIPNLPNE